jgi:hypothetical protein
MAGYFGNLLVELFLRPILSKVEGLSMKNKKKK